MAGILEGAHADEGYANTGGPKDGPVLTMMSKRLRALRKKFNRILQIEENKAQGKTVNKEQEEVLKTKIAIAALIDEYEKLRQPLLIAVKEEVAEREKDLLAASLEREDEEASVADERGAAEQEVAVGLKAVEEKEIGNADEVTEDVAGLANGFLNGGAVDLQGDATDSESYVPVEDHEVDSLSSRGAVMTDAQIGDLLSLLYFSQLFDVRSPEEMPSYVWTKVHERSSCLSYDFVRDDATKPLIEGDLDALSMFGSLLTTRPPNVTLSHKVALEKCVDHAKAWLAISENPIGDSHPELNVSYSGLRERLNRILGSEYFTMTPEITTVNQQTAAAAAATAAGQYVTKVFVQETPVIETIGGKVVVDTAEFLQDGAVDLYPTSKYNMPPVPLVVANGMPVPSPLMTVVNTVSFVPETLGTAVELPQFGSHDGGNQESPDTDAIPELEHENTQSVPIHQAQPQNQGYYGGNSRAGGYQNPRGRTGYAGGRGRGGGFLNGRNGRGRGGYPNGGRGDRQFYEGGGQGGFYPRNQNYFGGGGGGGRGGHGPRGGYNGYNCHSNGPAAQSVSPESSPAVATESA